MSTRTRNPEATRSRILEAAFQEARKVRSDAVVTIQSALFYALNGRLAELSLQYRLPVLSAETGFAEAG